jgi:hypothetical protein
MEGLDKYVNFDIHGKGSRILLLLKASLRADFENEVVTNNVDLPEGAPPELYDLIDLNCLAGCDMQKEEAPELCSSGRWHPRRSSSGMSEWKLRGVF